MISFLHHAQTNVRSGEALCWLVVHFDWQRSLLVNRPGRQDRFHQLSAISYVFCCVANIIFSYSLIVKPDFIMSQIIQEKDSRQGSALLSEGASKIDLEAYFRRIGYTGERTPTLDTLKGIHLKHPGAIAFENLNPLLRLPVRLDITSLQQKILFENRGGYCFEHNLLLSHVLQALGFKVKGLAARVLWNLPEGVIPARGHMLLLVEVEGEACIADVGFGGNTLTAPLRLVPDMEQSTPHEPYRLVKAADEYILEAKVREVWKPLYRFSLQEQFLSDYEVSSWYLSNHPDSHFVTGLIAARSTPDRRYALRGNELAVHHTGGDTERTTFTSVAALKRALEDVFLLQLPAHPALDATLERLIGQAK